jgi:L-gulonolactone oxidase
MMALEGRPHWAKEHAMTPQQLHRMYPKMRAFLQMREQVDPHGLFVNDYIQRHLLLESKL